MDEDPEELIGFSDDAAWDFLDEAEDEENYSDYFPEEGDEVWQS